ncbi:conserved hypothetical protein [Flavobacterium sp. 9AF]|uniref:hypothetical protein n=1 Tax=Flavobacterium sp. 9AF TaxID=2653142 RepID=UPI0012F3D6BD|nr:hypothetical protein [Flavobacterium sp. 9AF]VXB51600.1 conserved hypothetical protein [Flavobacterium sp. 9AF]
MKKFFTLVFLLGISITFSQENDQPEHTGDNFSLEGALAIFKKSTNLEDFEKMINEENNNVNNLDLNDDGEIDYIIVNDIQENDTHVIVLSTYLNDTEKQDIAIIGIEKTGNEEAILQIEGDEDLYAENTIIEPSSIEEKIDKSGKGPNSFEVNPTAIIINVWFWPSVRYIYAPGYVVWKSPYRWRNYPRGWKPWKPYGHTVFYTRCAPHRVHYIRTPTRRVVVARKVYTPRRSRSTVVVHSRRGTTVVHKNKRGKTTVVKTKKRARR